MMIFSSLLPFEVGSLAFGRGGVFSWSTAATGFLAAELAGFGLIASLQAAEPSAFGVA